MDDRMLERAYAECRALARRHYENFPVGSWLLPRDLRRPVTVIYAFARTADDCADEGDLDPATRLARLDELGRMLDDIGTGAPQSTPLGLALADTVTRHALPLTLFHDLLQAFRQDVNKTRYASFGELMDYCRRSANPIGRLLLHLQRETDPRNLAYSDAICSALQLINFYQDLAQDYAEHDRIYIPLDELQRFDVTEDHFRHRSSDFGMRRLMHLQYDRALRLLQSGAPLGKRLRGRFGFELRMIVLGGSRVLQHLLASQDDLFARPRLHKSDWLWMTWHALLAR